MRRSYYVLVGPLTILALWFAVTQFHLIDPIFLSPPIKTFNRLFNLLALGDILPDVGWTVIRWLIGLVIGVLLGIPIGLLMGASKKIYGSLEVLVDFSRSIPVMTLFPLALVLFGIGNQSKIALAAWASLIYVVINTIYGVRHVREARIRMARSLRATRFQIFMKIIIPDALPEVFVGIRMSISMSLVIVVASEMIMGTNTGLGKRIFDAGMLYQISDMYAAIIIAGILGYLSNKAFVAMENSVIHWSGK